MYVSFSPCYLNHVLFFFLCVYTIQMQEHKVHCGCIWFVSCGVEHRSFSAVGFMNSAEQHDYHIIVEEVVLITVD